MITKDLASDYKINTEQYKFASDEIKRRLALQIKKSKKSKDYLQKNKEKIQIKNNRNKNKKMPIKKAEKLYYYLLENDKIKINKKVTYLLLFLHKIFYELLFLL